MTLRRSGPLPSSSTRTTARPPLATPLATERLRLLPGWLGPYPIVYAAIRGGLFGGFVYLAWDAREQLATWGYDGNPKVLVALLWGLQIVSKIGTSLSLLWIASRPRYGVRHVLLAAFMVGVTLAATQLVVLPAGGL